MFDEDGEGTKLCSMSSLGFSTINNLADDSNQVDFVLVWDEKSQVGLVHRYL